MFHLHPASIWTQDDLYSSVKFDAPFIFSERYKNFRIPLAKPYKYMPDNKATQNLCDAHYIIILPSIQIIYINIIRVFASNAKYPTAEFSAMRFIIYLYIIRFLVITCFINLNILFWSFRIFRRHHSA